MIYGLRDDDFKSIIMGFDLPQLNPLLEPQSIHTILHAPNSYAPLWVI